MSGWVAVLDWTRSSAAEASTIEDITNTGAPTTDSMAVLVLVLVPVLVLVLATVLPRLTPAVVVHMITDVVPVRDTGGPDATPTINTSMFHVAEAVGAEIHIMFPTSSTDPPCPSRFFSSLVSRVITLESTPSTLYGC